jgi:hypothetical protein
VKQNKVLIFEIIRTSPVRGYPMSNFVQNELNPSFVSYEALEVACHALETYSGRLTDLESEKFKVRYYRLLINCRIYMIALTR